MTIKFLNVVAAAMLVSVPALAQSAGTTPVTPAPTVATDAQGKLLLGAPLEITSSGASELEGEAETLFVIDAGNLKSSGTWTDADRKACKASGGIELPISAGRIACFRL